ncbi:unnamed protein product [Rhizoctonia solani]|uniref:DUF6533 domain-containing protein n=1 Tax=Rhizoctonia solani TaxID=456999 RepID=A0A8H2XSZ4_9AGAM|nr:unnamed protein product [Rhizoctonia solani]
MSLPGFELKDIVDTIIFYHGQQQIAKYLAVVSITLLVYDWVLNLDLEVAFIWGHSWSWGRVIYHTNRVWPIALLGITLSVILFLPLPNPSTKITLCQTCKQVGFMYSYGAMCQCTIISAMLLLRCWAIYDKKWVVWMLSGALVVAVISGVVIIKFLLDRTIFLDNPLPNIFSGCVVVVPDYVWILYIMPLIYESTLFFLMIWRIYTLTKDCEASPLMQTLARNGMAYFATLVGLMILACIGGTIPTVKIAANASG